MKRETRICLHCIGDVELRNLLRETATRMKCKFCESRRLGVPLKTLAGYIDEVYRGHFKPGDWYSVPGQGADDRTYQEQEGSTPRDIIAEIAGLEPEVVDEIVTLLADEEYHDVRDGEEPYYAYGCHYVHLDYVPVEQQWSWNEFYHRIKHQRRYFDDVARSRLHGLLGDLETLEPAPVLILHPNDTHRVIFRARRASHGEQAEKFCADARREIGPPPPAVVTAGRMNAHGIPVFYGAFSEAVAVAEVRPYVGGLIAVAQFEVIRPLKLLDLSRYVREPSPISLFAPGYYSRVTQLRFLRQFISIISRPIQPSDEALEYVATQAVAEYLANELKFDGIVYPSAQVGGMESDDDDLDSDDDALLSSRNVALFEAIGIVEGANQDTHASKSTDEVNADDNAITGPDDIFRDLIYTAHNEPYSSEPEGKGPALRYVEHSARVVKVTAIKVSYESFYLWGGDG